MVRSDRHATLSETWVQNKATSRRLREKVLLMQANAAAKQRCPLHRGTHAKDVCAREQFEVFDVTAGRDSVLAARLAQCIFTRPGIFPATIRFGNSDSPVKSDFKPDVRSLSFFVDLTARMGQRFQRPVLRT